MTSMRVKCLVFLLQHAHHEAIDKEQLALAVWGERGQYVTASNLTQLIYLVRKDLKTCGISDFLETIPRHGFRINRNADIQIQYQQKKNSSKYNMIYQFILTLFVFFTP
ncbi:winged helix-turn-helix domain-containing protein [Pseudocitrobacter corydidari]|uniref:winged helix-turn-helix domain-containing protein n=1 Tax=Pseudocitrobacter corydidari TaxID=2891570 RepID=UPI00210728F9|nr:winged helix-turn-helix domain-containing protein [Pseudocitrobacter corydidari]